MEKMIEDFADGFLEGFGSMIGSAMGFIVGLIFICFLAFCVFNAIVMWRCFKKINEPGWKSLIPFYNTWVLCKHTWGHGVMMLTWLVPYIGSVMQIITYWKLYKGFGKGDLFCILGIFFPFITTPICAFDRSVYTEPAGIKIIN